MASDRVVLEVSMESYELLQAALGSHLEAMAKLAPGVDLLGDTTAFKKIQKDYFHGQNLLKKLEERRSIVGVH
jgi:hypothetical protein